MFVRFSSALSLCLLAAVGPVAAETYETYLDKSGTGDTFQASVGFNTSCGEECHAADLSCAAQERINLSLNGYSPKAAATLITNEGRKLVVIVSGEKFDFTFMKTEYEGEMTGDWSVDGLLNGEAAPFLNALKKAKTFKASFGTKSLTLPVTKDVADWVKSCPK